MIFPSWRGPWRIHNPRSTILSVSLIGAPAIKVTRAMLAIDHVSWSTLPSYMFDKSFDNNASTSFDCESPSLKTTEGTRSEAQSLLSTWRKVAEVAT